MRLSVWEAALEAGTEKEPETGDRKFFAGGRHMRKGSSAGMEENTHLQKDRINRTDGTDRERMTDREDIEDRKDRENTTDREDGTNRRNRINTRDLPDHIEVRGAKVHNLKNIDVDIPLNEIVGIAGVSGSGKSSLALGILYAEGSRRYLESLSTYTRRRMTQASRADVDEVRYIPAALALRQRPGVPDIRSTFGTGTELLNSLRLMFSRLASHRCPNGHYVKPTLNVAAMKEIICPVCGARVDAPGAEDLAFNSRGACPTCQGTGQIQIVDESTLVPDENKTIDEGAVLPWQTLMWSIMKDVARKMGVRTDVPFKDLTPKERDIVFHGPAVKQTIVYQNRTNGAAGDVSFTYFNAKYTVENALAKVKDEKGMKRLEKFLKIGVCPDCHGTRLSEAARAPRIRGISLADACKMSLTELCAWVDGVPASLPEEMRPMAENICESFRDAARRLLDLGLGYLTLDRAASTLSTGERQRMQFARAVRNRTTGVLYLLDEPSIGLHPANQSGLAGVMDDLVRDGNSVVLVDHDTNILQKADWLIEMGPGAGTHGGTVIAQGTVQDLQNNPASVIGPFLREQQRVGERKNARISKESLESGSGAGNSDSKLTAGSVESGIGTENSARKTVEKSPFFPTVLEKSDLFSLGRIHMETEEIHTVKPLSVDIPRGRLTVVTGVSGSGKTTMILESLVPALEAKAGKGKMPPHVRKIEAAGIEDVKLIDATPIGINVRSTVATYANVHDELRKVFARIPEAKKMGYSAGDFSYNTGKLRCPTCDGTGEITLDVQFLPDVNIPCPDCRGSRYSGKADRIRHVPKGASSGYSLPELMSKDIDEVLDLCRDLKLVHSRLQILHDLGLGYLTLGEATPHLSGGEAQRLKLASEMGRPQETSLFVFDEPTIGLHPLDVRSLIGLFRSLIAHGATVAVIEHDLDVIRAADYIIDMGPGGGEEGGRIVGTGTPADIAAIPESKTGKYL